MALTIGKRIGLFSRKLGAATTRARVAREHKQLGDGADLHQERRAHKVFEQIRALDEGGRHLVC